MSYKSSEETSSIQTQQSLKTTPRCIIYSILLILGFLGLIIGLSLFIGLTLKSETPHTKFNIVEASIMQFNLTNNTLYYNFKVTITVQNFHRDMLTHEFIAIASYKGNQLASVNMAPFILNSDNIVMLEPIVFEGNSGMVFKPHQLVEYNKETQLGIYNLDLDLNVNRDLTHLHCPNFKVPLISNGKVAPTFNVTKCHKVDAEYH
jgi:hypothetical protein